MSGSGKDHVKIGIVQIFVFLALLGGLSVVFFQFAIPVGIAKFVVPLFEPEPEKLAKSPFAHFEDEGLVFAAVKTSEAANLGINKIGEEYPPKVSTVKGNITKAALNTEYLFDFTFKVRNSKDHGYIKTASEFYVKAPKLGEEPIILEPYVGFTILALVLAGVFTVILTIVFPSSIGIMAALFENQVEHTKVKIRLQTGFTDEVVNILTLPDNKLKDYDREEAEKIFKTIWSRTTTETEMTSKRGLITFNDLFDDETDLVLFRNSVIYTRVKEFFSEFVLSEIIDTRDGIAWKANHLKIGAGLRLYLAHHFSEKYSNNVTGLAYAGAAVLIIAVGIRGLKFIPANKPSLILFAILLEFTLLSLMAITIFYTEEEERMDKLMKKMEDANRSQLETLRGQQSDIHSMSNALVGDTSRMVKEKVEAAISEYMSSGDQVQRQIAQSIADKIIFDIKGPDKPKRKSI